MLTVNEIPRTIFHSSVLHDHYSKWVVIFIHDVAMNERKEPTSRQPEIDRFFSNGRKEMEVVKQPASKDLQTWLQSTGKCISESLHVILKFSGGGGAYLQTPP